MPDSRLSPVLALGFSWTLVEADTKAPKVVLVNLCHTWFGFLGSQDATQALGFLPPRASMAGYLDQHIGLWNVNGVVSHLGQEDCVHLHVPVAVTACK